MGFHAGELIIFDRAGAKLGVVTGWSVTAPRGYRLNEIDDFSIHIPQRNQFGATILDSTVAAMLKKDNLVYIEDELPGIPGWGGVIDEVVYRNERAEVHLLSGESLLTALETDTIEQSGGDSSTVAQRLVSAANAKQGAHGDAVMGFVIDGLNPLYGTYTYAGDIWSGIQQLSTDTSSDCYVEPILGPGATSLSFRLHWGPRKIVDHTSIVLTDGPGGNLKSGSEFLTSGLEVVNRVRLRGAPTHLTDFLDYDSVKGVVKDVSPEVELTLDDPANANFRRREDLNLTVNFGLSDDYQRQIATTGYDTTDILTGEVTHHPGIQETYLGYYKSFLYAYHNRQGKPFLEGFDWSGPNGTNDKNLTERYYRTCNKLGLLGASTIVTSETDGTMTDALIDNWALDQELDTGLVVTGIAIDWNNPGGHWLSQSADATLYLLDSDNVTLDVWSSAGPGTVHSVATDPQAINTVWVLVQQGSVYRVKSYDIDGLALLTSFVIPAAVVPNDIAVDVVAGRLYVVGSGDGNVHVYDINSGTALSPDPTYASGVSAPVGLSASGGLTYVVDAAGHVKMTFIDSGNLAGTFDTGLTVNGMLVDLPSRRIWIVRGDGILAVYHAYIAVGTAGSNPTDILGAPGFEQLLGGTFVHVVMTSDHARKPSTAATQSSSTTYTVKSGDSLWKIAVKFYHNGSLWRTIYRANKAIIGSNPSLIYPGQVFRIPGTKSPGTTVTSPNVTKYFITWSVGHWQQDTIPGPIGQPDQIQRSWVIDNDQRDATTNANRMTLADPECVIVGEEGRVDDWQPTRDGYGEYKESQIYRTKSGHTIDAGPGWYPHEWDVPDRTFEPPNKPDWPEGRAYLGAYLAQRNRETSVQTLTVINLDNLWANIERGGTYTLTCTKQGPIGVGVTGTIRVLGFSPNEYTGEMELAAEFL